MTAGAVGVFGRRASGVKPALNRLLAGERGDRLQSAFVGLGVLVLSILAGAAVLDPRWSVLVLPAIGLTVLIGIAAASRGALVGFTVLGVLNGVPGLDLESFAVSGSFRPHDLLILFLVGALLLWHLTTSAEHLVDRRWLGWARTWAFIFVAWWLLTFARSVFFSDIPALQAALYGRDFLYFGILLPLLPVAFRRRSDLVALVAVVGAGGAIFALGQIATSLFPSVSAVFDPSLLINETLTNEFEGVTRVYAYMGEVVVLGAIIAAGVAILARSRRGRVVSSSLFVLLTVASLSQLSRAAYAAMVAGFVLLLFAALFRAPAPWKWCAGCCRHSSSLWRFFLCSPSCTQAIPALSRPRRSLRYAPNPGLRNSKHAAGRSGIAATSSRRCLTWSATAFRSVSAFGIRMRGTWGAFHRARSGTPTLASSTES